MQPVRFVQQVEQAVASGVSVFIEVGPGSTASSLINHIDPTLRVVSLERPGRPMSGVLDALAELWTMGAVSSVQALFEGRLPLPGEDALRGTDDTTWFVDGGGVRRGRMDGDYDGREPMLTAETAGQVLASPDLGSSDAVVEFQRTMQDFLRVHEQVMEQALGQSTSGARRPRISPPAPSIPSREVPARREHAEPVPTVSPSDVTGPVDTQEVLVALISDRTGFDPGVIGADMDLESELGVDSIKRVEILSLLRERLGIARREGVDLSRLRTVREIVSALQETEVRASSADMDELPRLVREWVDAPAAEGEAFRTSEVEGDNDTKAADVLIDAALDALGRWQTTPAELSIIEGALGPARTVAAAARCVVAERGNVTDVLIRVPQESGLRSVDVRLTAQETGPVDLSVVQGNVVLAFGGTRGITRSALQALPDCTVVVVGRSAAEWDLPEGWQALPADVRDIAQVDSVVDAVLAEHGRVDGVVFGSGVLSDAPLADLDLEDARTVIETKVLGLNNICQSLSRAQCIPTWLVAFGSVTAAFGNPAQSAYAAANEAMSVLAANWADRWPATGVRVIQWGPWFGAGVQGMVSEVVADLLEERGIRVIDPVVGARAFAIETVSAAVDPGFVDVVIGAGPWVR
jgi:NAD(P)-dependent dehydrogenase (short-subunit alcohol dehydrogenase family)/acyl carrier protein